MQGNNRVAVAIVVGLALGAAGCDDRNEQNPPQTASPPSSAAPTSAPTAAPAASSASVDLGKPSAEVGDKYTTTLKVESVTQLTDPELPGVKEGTGMGSELVIATEVLAVGNGRETKWKLTFEKARMRLSWQGEEKEEAMPIEGKTFTAEKKGDEVAVTTPDGKPASEHDSDFVETAVQLFDSWRLPDGPFVPGEAIPALAKQAPKEDLEGGEVTVTARFVKRQGDHGLFERKATVVLDGGKMDMTCHAVIRLADGRALASVCDSGKLSVPHDDASKSTGRFRVTATRQAPGEPPPALPPADALDGSSGSSGAFDTVCYGGEDLTDKQRFYIQDQSDNGADVCPAWTQPTVVVGDDGITLQGQTIVAKEELPSASELVEIKPLFARLNAYRDRWKSIHPADPFDAHLTVKASPGTPTARVISVYVSSSRAAYFKARIEAGGIGVDVQAFIPGPPDVVPSSRVLYVEPLDGGKALVGLLREGPKLEPKTELGSMKELDAWLAPHCKDPGKACFDRLIFRPQLAPIEETLKALEPVLKAKPLAAKPPAINFELRCPASAVPTREEAIKGPWGKREPAGPCF